MTFLGWCKSEGKLRYPEFFSASGGSTMLDPIAARVRISFPVTIRLLFLLMAPRSGKALRARAQALLRNEGFGGFARRLRDLR